MIRASLIRPCASHARGNHGRARALCGRDPAQERITLQRETTAASGGRPPRDGVIDQRFVWTRDPLGIAARSRLLCTVP